MRIKLARAPVDGGIAGAKIIPDFNGDGLFGRSDFASGRAAAWAMTATARCATPVTDGPMAKLLAGRIQGRSCLVCGI